MEQKREKLMAIFEPEIKTLEHLMLINHDEKDVSALVVAELEHLKTAAMTQPAISECIPASIVIAVKTAIRQNLSLDPAAGLVYIKTRSIKTGFDSNGKDVYSKSLEIQPSANGLISYNRMCGRILDIDRPEVTKDAHGKVIEVSVNILFPSNNSSRWAKISFDESDFERWKRASHKENGRYKKDADDSKMNYANPNYTSWKGGLDPEFARAKCIRHALKKLGTNPNERIFKTINADEIQLNIVDSKADEQAFSDEFVVHEEISTVAQNEYSNSNFEIPNINQL